MIFMWHPLVPAPPGGKEPIMSTYHNGLNFKSAAKLMSSKIKMAFRSESFKLLKQKLFYVLSF